MVASNIQLQKEEELDSKLLLPEGSKVPKQRPWRSRHILNGPLALFLGLVFYYYIRSGDFHLRRCDSNPTSGFEKSTLMDVFQVYPPVRVGQDFLPDLEEEKPECSVVLMEHVFGWSYGKPFVGTYTPPKCEWTHVLFNLTMTSAGRQFDRLAMMFLGDIEVFRTSTAEPTWSGIVFNYAKDMTAYSSLLKEKQKIIFDLGNLVDDTYTGSFNATLTGTFYTPTPTYGKHFEPANEIFAISQHKSAHNEPSYYRLPQDRAKETISLPPGTIRATVSISASGNAAEEFWYTNVPNDFTATFGPENMLPGHSPFREIQLLVDGEILGVAWPFATIFTGGINPGLWRPVVGIAAFDIPEYTIDITPFLPLLLSRPKLPVFEIKLVSWDPNPVSATKIDSDWLVSGRVFVWTDPHDKSWTTTGTIHKRSSGPPTFKLMPTLETNPEGTRNTSLELHLTAHRFLSVTSTINTSSGPRLASWTQGLSYSHTNNLSAYGSHQTVRTVTQGTTAAIGTRAQTFRWPLTIVTSFEVDPLHGNFTIHADVDRSVEEAGFGLDPVFSLGPGTLYTRLNGSAIFVSGRYAKGETEQNLEFVGVPRNGEAVGSYKRRVKAVGGSLVRDDEVINGKAVEKETYTQEGAGPADEWAVSGRGSVRSILGRGPK